MNADKDQHAGESSQTRILPSDSRAALSEEESEGTIRTSQAIEQLATNRVEQLVDTVKPKLRSELAKDAQQELANQRIERLIDIVESKLRGDLAKDAQQELADLINLLPEIERSRRYNLVRPVEVAVTALLEYGDVEFARRLKKDLQRRLRFYRTVYASPSSALVSGLGALFILAVYVIPLIVVVVTWTSGPEPSNTGDREPLGPIGILGLDTSLLIVTAIVGAVGSIVSIMIRAQDFTEKEYPDPRGLFFTGLFKPIIGGAFAVFIFAVLNSGLLPINADTPEAQIYLLVALSFIAGFSERFARDVVTRTEEGVVGSKSDAT